ncbi:glycosyltransferase family 4 protein [Xanthobacter wiegelii]|uniref:glycosyltransferase family 4 protein n=1 Tax=Xanthobacter wiegelii TaxID=3119913 RepID=UPI0037263728
MPNMNLGGPMPRPQNRSILFYGALPPPVTGMAAVNKDMTDKLSAHCKVVKLNSSTAHTRGSAFHILTKALGVMLGFFVVIGHRIGGIRTLYSSADDGLGMVGTIAIVSAARLMGMRIFIHHHSYKYISRRSMLMALLVRSGGPTATHIFLCDAMGTAFRASYLGVGKSLIVPNAVKDVAMCKRLATASSPDRPLTLGFLSNLTLEKGLGEAIAVVEKCVQQGWNVRGVLAGPAVSAEASARITSALERLNGRLEWRGAVYGKEKEQFFSELDLFLFPTKYVSESFGLVISEALIRGVPVIAWERGCIGLFQQVEAALILDTEADFISHAEARIRAFLDDPALLVAMMNNARDQGRDLNAMFEDAQNQLVTIIAGGKQTDVG